MSPRPLPGTREQLEQQLTGVRRINDERKEAVLVHAKLGQWESVRSTAALILKGQSDILAITTRLALPAVYLEADPDGQVWEFGTSSGPNDDAICWGVDPDTAHRHVDKGRGTAWRRLVTPAEHVEG